MTAPITFGVELLEHRPKPPARIKTELTYQQWRSLNAGQRRAYERERGRNRVNARASGPNPKEARQAAVNREGLEFMARTLGIKIPGVAKCTARQQGPSDEEIRAELAKLPTHKSETQTEELDEERHNWTVPGVDP